MLLRRLRLAVFLVIAAGLFYVLSRHQATRTIRKYASVASNGKGLSAREMKRRQAQYIGDNWFPPQPFNMDSWTRDEQLRYAQAQFAAYHLQKPFGTDLRRWGAALKLLRRVDPKLTVLNPIKPDVKKSPEPSWFNFYSHVLNVTLEGTLKDDVDKKAAVLNTTASDNGRAILTLVSNESFIPAVQLLRYLKKYYAAERLVVYQHRDGKGMPLSQWRRRWLKNNLSLEPDDPAAGMLQQILKMNATTAIAPEHLRVALGVLPLTLLFAPCTECLYVGPTAAPLLGADYYFSLLKEHDAVLSPATPNVPDETLKRHLAEADLGKAVLDKLNTTSRLVSSSLLVIDKKRAWAGLVGSAALLSHSVVRKKELLDLKSVQHEDALWLGMELAGVNWSVLGHPGLVGVSQAGGSPESTREAAGKDYLCGQTFAIDPVLGPVLANGPIRPEHGSFDGSYFAASTSATAWPRPACIDLGREREVSVKMAWSGRDIKKRMSDLQSFYDAALASEYDF